MASTSGEEAGDGREDATKDLREKDGCGVVKMRISSPHTTSPRTGTHGGERDEEPVRPRMLGLTVLRSLRPGNQDSPGLWWYQLVCFYPAAWLRRGSVAISIP